MKFNGDLGPEKIKPITKEKMEKKSSRHGETIKSSKSIKINPTIKQNEDKNRRHSINKMSQGTIRERNKKNVKNNKQVFAFCFFN